MDSLKLLSVGNSFSDDAMEYVWQIASALGFKKIELGNLYIGGCSLATHRENALSGAEVYEFRTNTDGVWRTENKSLVYGVTFRDWDVVSLQQASPFSGREETYNEDLFFLIDFIKRRAKNPNVKLVWHMTWAYAKDSEHEAFANYGQNQGTMYEMIVKTVQKKILPTNVFSTVIPSGTAIQNARTSFLGDSLNRDGFHLSIPLGRYVAGLTLVTAVTGADISQIAYAPEGVSDAERAAAVESAENACRAPFAVTPSRYMKKDF